MEIKSWSSETERQSNYMNTNNYCCSSNRTVT